NRLIITKSLGRVVRCNLHSSHQGQVRTKGRACQVVFWPGLNNDVNAALHITKEPMMSEPVPDLPFQNVSAILFKHCGFQYPVNADCLSG
ncbi:hypothetical protein TCAL_12316, partial [Tigriopus californicus]